ncbi:MAG: hypothetical protein RLZZ546_1704 [Bacteroidota bacterium]|jgi:ABC-type transport system involved in multi-copper enzyme maturation permease subunit
MKKLIEIEFLKFRKNNVILVLTAIFVFVFPWSILLFKDIFKNATPPFPSTSAVYEFPTVWDYNGYAGSWFVCFCLGFVMLYVITSEVGNKTMRQSIINGLTKKEYFISKLLTLLNLSLVSTIVYALSTLALGLYHTSDVDFDLLFDTNYAPFKFFLMNVGYLSLALFFGFLVRRGTLALLTYFSYVLFLEMILRMIHLYYFKTRAIIFYPANVFEDLMPNPMFKGPDVFFAKEWGFKPLLSSNEAILVSILYIIIFVSSAWWLFKNKDVK